MNDTTEQESKKRLGLAKPGRLELKTVETGQVRQSFPHGRTKTVQVEVRKKRVFGTGAPITAKTATARSGAPAESGGTATEAPTRGGAAASAAEKKPAVLRTLTDEERAQRSRALQGAIRADVEAKRRDDTEAKRFSEELQRQAEDEARRKIEDEARRKVDEEAKRKSEEEARKRAEEETKRLSEEEAKRRQAAPTMSAGAKAAQILEEEEESRRKRPGVSAAPRRPSLAPKREEPRRRPGKITLAAALDEEETIRMRSLAAMRRAREKERQRLAMLQMPATKVVRDVVIPEAITVQELANRMAERSSDVIKALMKMDVMATINQTIDADMAELVVTEFGHRMKRVTEADVEIGLKGATDSVERLQPRPPVVTVMGHVDHGKTSLLDALRETDVAKHEAGGITQHIGAYQVELKSGKRITFLDTPGHEAFTAMRARGASVTDIVILVVAADDGIQPQTVEAINHAKAANAPVIVAINKIDKPDANADKVRRGLLQHGIALEEMGGDVLAVEVSATKKTNLDRLEEAILLQAEVLELKANPDRPAEGVIIEAKLERGRGPVATVLIQKGTLKVGDIFVAGSESGKVRALLDDKGRSIDMAGPAAPVEVLGLDGTPLAGDDLAVVESEARAREVTDFRTRRTRDARTSAGGRGTLEQMFSKIAEGEAKALGIVVKTDVQGSLEAICGAMAKLGTKEVAVQVLHSAVGAITEGDVVLAKASNGMIVGFNVRANPQAREVARRDGVEIRYYSVIYDIIDDMKALLSGMLAPGLRERQLGNAEIREVFNVSKAGKVAGCRVTSGVVRRGAKVRLLRDGVVIHTGALKSLRRFKEEVREVQEGYECGMAFESYQDIQQGDVVECFEVEEVARSIA
ncbi:MAG: translation initiation factor IF-2 [Proteobacteria bacterium]|nr:translation initiation factor IF-2 [Pseudomonadota bacterium]